MAVTKPVVPPPTLVVWYVWVWVWVCIWVIKRVFGMAPYLPIGEASVVFLCFFSIWRFGWKVIGLSSNYKLLILDSSKWMLIALEFSFPLSESYYSSGSFWISSINFYCFISKLDCILLKLFLFLNIPFCFLFNISGGAIFPPSWTVSVSIVNVYWDLIY